MKIAITSDMHLLDKSSRDEIERAKDLINFMDFAYSNYDLWILNGDTIDSSEMFVKFLSCYSDLIKLINKDKTIIIEGNHDIRINKLNSLYGFKIWNSYSTEENFLIFHGHQFDEMCKHSTWLNRGAILLSYVIPGIKDIPCQQKYPEEFMLEARKYAHRLLYDGIIFGHTHQANVEKIEDIVVANSGTWVRKRNYLEYIDGEVTLKNWS